MVRHPPHVMHEEGFKIGFPRKAAKAREAAQLGRVVRQPLGLFVGDHLQAMLDLAQDEIGGAEVVHRVFGHLAVGAEFGEHFERARAAQVRPLAAEDQLLRLDEKLDFANAAATELDVMARHDDLGMAAHGMDLALHRVNVGDRGVVEIFAPDERR